ncbi:MAG: 6-pyruvoyl-tetrahydropterin synthase-related protein [Candidatus Altiarchaeota archaeon]
MSREGIKGFISKRLTVESSVNIVVLAIVYLFLLSIFKPDLMLDKTITTGGDMGSHYYPAKFLQEELLPRGHIIGWLPGWYVGMPLFQFYFPLSFVLIAVLGYIIPLQISFKIVTVLGIFILPLCAFHCMRLMRFSFPVPIFAATFTLPFLFQESHSMWGGNIPSTLAGEFSYGISLSLTILFFGLLYRGLEEKRHVLHNAVMLASIALTHVYTILWIVASSSFLLAGRKVKDVRERVLYMAKSYPLAFMLTGFWIIPLLSRLKYTTSYDIPWVITEDVLPPILWPFLLFSGIGIFACVRNRDKRMGFFCYSMLVSLVFFELAPKLGVVDIRFLPFIYITLMIIAAYGLQQAVKPLKGGWIVPLIVVILTIFWVNSSKVLVTGEKDKVEFHTDQIIPQLVKWSYGGFTPYWVKWNYEGFEKKPVWPEFKETNDYIKGGFNDPRAQFEHNDQHNSAGTVRAFESIPLFSGRSILEGLYMQSIISSPFVFYIQSEISEQQSCPFWAVYPCTSFNLENGTEHLKMFNTRFIVARSDKLKKAMRENRQWRLAHSADPFEVWELTTNPDHYVTVPKNEPVLFETSLWKNISYQWFRGMELIDTPIVFKAEADDVDTKRFSTIFKNPTITDLDRIEKNLINSDCNIKELIGAEEIEFSTDCIGAPHIISISYYPSWKPEGADRVYLVSPSFMLVYPTQNRVKLTYSKTWEDWLGMLLTLSATAIISYAFLTRNQRVRRFFNL